MITTQDAKLRAASVLPEFTHELPLCHKSINSKAAVIHEIRKRELEHWYSGLRQAELFIDEKSCALETFFFDCKKNERELRKAEREQKELEELGDLTEAQQDKHEELQDLIDLSTRRLLRSRAEVRDAIMEREAAVSERNRILAAHPEAQALSYEEMQEMFTPAMLQERQARYIAARVWAAQNNLPEGVGESVFSVPPEQREALLAREAELRTGGSIASAKSQALAILAGLPEEQAQQALILAANHVLACQKHLQEGSQNA